MTAFIDAKYKSHLLAGSESGPLRDDLRRDIDQVLAYTRHTLAGKGIAVICYPSDHVELKTTDLHDPSTGAENLLIVGVPLKRSAIPDAVTQIANKLDTLRA